MEQRKKNWPKFVVIISGLLLFIVVGLVVGAFWLINEFRASTIPDEKEEEKVIEQAEQYLVTKYPNMKYDIQYVLYDAGEQHGNFDYAAVVLNTETKESFMVYENRYTEKMEDDISIQKATEFMEQVTPKVYSYINEIFGETEGISFTPSYEVGGTPTLNIRLNNKKEEINEEMFLSLIDYLQNKLNIEHAHVTIMYNSENEKWVKEF